jgi:hypothetical protein
MILTRLRLKDFFTIFHPDISIVRSWHGHKIETRWFYCIEGDFDIRAVKIDNWANPSDILNSETLMIIKIPAENDEFRFDKDKL